MRGHKVVEATGNTSSLPYVVTLRCPHCRHVGAFAGFANCTDIQWATKNAAARVEIWAAGMRRCPNPACTSLVFVVLYKGKLDECYPPELIDFDASNLPPRILETLDETVKAHAAGCYRASALMVRRLLEELCRDKNAQGKDLKVRLAALGGSIVVPQELLDAADELRLFGNDAAHVEAKAYDDIGEDEATIAIELAKELLKAVYQYTTLLGKLKALKKL